MMPNTASESGPDFGADAGPESAHAVSVPFRDNAIEVDGLVKRFGRAVAVDGVSFTVPRGAVYALLGPNGAGKTTTVRLLATLLRPDAGHARIDGIDVARHPAGVRTRIGLTGQYAAVEDRLTARENLMLVGRLHHLPRRELAERTTELIERFALGASADRIVQGFSGGTRRRLDIAMSLIAKPSVLFLDEPTTGLDPRSRLAMWELIEELGGDGTTVLLTTQYLDEADRLADRIVLVDAGRVIASGTAEELKLQIGGDHLDVTIARPDEAEAAIAALQPLCGGAVTVLDDDRLRLSATIGSADRIVPAAIRVLDAAGVDVVDVRVRRPTLDDVFLQLTGHTVGDVARDGDGDGDGDGVGDGHGAGAGEGDGDGEGDGEGDAAGDRVGDVDGKAAQDVVGGAAGGVADAAGSAAGDGASRVAGAAEGADG
jgi:ABC-2 type transport system ATP-binding protein